MYQVIHKESGKEKTLIHQEVNDIFVDALGRIIVCGTDQELYWLIANSDSLID